MQLNEEILRLFAQTWAGAGLKDTFTFHGYFWPLATTNAGNVLRSDPNA